jgi:ATP-binding cassette subfamily B (MDR/TAP) protein 1
VQALFESKLEGPRRQMLHRSQIAGVTLGVANFVSFAAMALVYWYGGLLQYRGEGTFGEFFKVFLIFVNTSRTIGEAGALTPDFAKASTAIDSVFQILDRKTQIDSDVQGVEEMVVLKGDIEFKDVYFAYPSRPDVKLFRGFNLQIQAGQTVAMVGQSGSGKSTIVGLIERFYDPQKGTIYIDGKDLSKMNLKSVRHHISLVNQEPTLFALSIRDNIAYGKEGATDAEIIEAAKAANAHNFIRLES